MAAYLLLTLPAGLVLSLPGAKNGGDPMSFDNVLLRTAGDVLPESSAVSSRRLVTRRDICCLA